MKKFIVLIIAVAVLVVTYSAPALAIDREASYAVYVRGETAGSIWLYNDIYMTECNRDTAINYRNIHNAVGYSKRFKGSYTDLMAEAKNHNARILKSENVGGVYIYYGYSDKLGRTVNVDGMGVNIQLALRGKTITVGTPLIMGSY